MDNASSLLRRGLFFSATDDAWSRALKVCGVVCLALFIICLIACAAITVRHTGRLSALNREIEQAERGLARERSDRRAQADALADLRYQIAQLGARSSSGGAAAMGLQQAVAARQRAIAQRDNAIAQQEADLASMERRVDDEMKSYGVLSTYGSVLQTLVIFMTVCGSLYSLRQSRQQYRATENWKALEFVTAEVHRFKDDRSVRNAMHVLEYIEADYDLRLMLEATPELLRLSQQGVAVEKTSATTADGMPYCEVVISDKQIVMDAFTPDGEEKRDVITGQKSGTKLAHSYVENRIAYEMDAFFTYLLHFMTFEKPFGDTSSIQIVDWSLLEPHLCYWLDLIGKAEGGGTSPAENLRRQLRAYIVAYYPKVDQFIAAHLPAGGSASAEAAAPESVAPGAAGLPAVGGAAG